MAEGGREALLAALEVQRNARRGLAVGLAVAVAVPLLFVVVLAGGQTTSPAPFYLGLAFVIFVGTSMLVGAILVGRRALRLAVHPAAIAHRGALLALAGVACWLGGAALLVTPRWALAGYLLPWAPLCTLGGVWALHTRYKRTTAVRWLGAIGAWLVVPGALVLADLTAVDLPGLVGAAPAPDILHALLLGAAWLVSAGGALGAAAAVRGDGDARVLAPLALLPAGGATAVAWLGPSPLALAALSGSIGLAWAPIAWQLRSVPRSAVPEGPDPLADSPAG